MKIRSLITSLLLVPSMALALSYDESNLPYSDAPSDLQTRIALDLLTDLEVIQGNDDGTFTGDRQINRAEFVTIVMRIKDVGSPRTTRCFPDVPSDSWYAEAVCKAKEDGIVEGEQGYFSPERPINYVEAVKVLVELFDLPTIFVEGDEWYGPYLRIADKEGLLLFEVALRPRAQGREADPAYFISRAQMTRLAAAFIAHNEGELDVFRAAQLGQSAEGSSQKSEEQSLSSESFSSAISPSSSLSSSFSSSKSYTYDTYGDVNMVQNFLILGEVSPVLASVKIFSDAQPINLTDINVTLNSIVQSVDSILVFDEEARLLGRASLKTGSTYSLSVRNHKIQIPKRENYSIYVRAQMKPFTFGGVSGETVEVSSIGIEGDGAWNNKAQSQTSTDSFPTFQTARSRITTVENADSANGALVGGPGQPIGSFSFSGETGDGQADLEVTDLTFQIEAAGGVTVANAELGADGTSDRMSCSIVSTTIVCSSIDPQFGSFEDRTRILTIYADVTVPSTSQTTSLRLSLNQAGSPSSAGSVTWTDGSTSFTWVPFGNPVARGTYYN